VCFLQNQKKKEKGGKKKENPNLFMFYTSKNVLNNSVVYGFFFS